MKQEIKWLIEEFVNSDAKWCGDIIDLCDAKKDVLCYEWLRAKPTWMDDCLPAAITGTVNQLAYLDTLYLQGSDKASLMLKDAIYLELETSLRDRIQDHYNDEFGGQDELSFYGSNN